MNITNFLDKLSNALKIPTCFFIVLTLVFHDKLIELGIFKTCGYIMIFLALVMGAGVLAGYFRKGK